MAIDLKLGKFAPSDVGQMEFYLRWLKKHEMRPGEDEPMGLILAAADLGIERVYVVYPGADTFAMDPERRFVALAWRHLANLRQGGLEI